MAPAASHALRSRAGRTARTRKKAARKSRAPRTYLIVLLACLLAMGFGFLWLRDSSLVEVRSVNVSGLTGSDPKDLVQAIERTAKGMTTLHIDNRALARLADRYPAIKEIRADPSLPNKMSLRVVHHTLIAQVPASRGKAVVTAEGSLVRDIKGAHLPRISVGQKVSGDRMTGRSARASLALLVAAPSAWRKQVKVVYVGQRGLVAVMRVGPKIYFGEGTDPERQWRAAARLLAEPSIRNASYIDVSSPGRAAVAGLGETAEQPAEVIGGPVIDPNASVPATPQAAGQGPQAAQTPGQSPEATETPAPGAVTGQTPTQQPAQPAPGSGSAPPSPAPGSAPQSQSPASGGASAQP